MTNEGRAVDTLLSLVEIAVRVAIAWNYELTTWVLNYNSQNRKKNLQLLIYLHSDYSSIEVEAVLIWQLMFAVHDLLMTALVFIWPTLISTKTTFPLDDVLKKFDEVLGEIRMKGNSKPQFGVVLIHQYQATPIQDVAVRIDGTAQQIRFVHILNFLHSFFGWNILIFLQ